MTALDDRILAALREATGPMTAPAIAAHLADGTTAAQVRRAIGRIRAGGTEIVCWTGRAGGYIAGDRDDLLFVPLAAVIAELDGQAA